MQWCANQKGSSIEENASRKEGGGQKSFLGLLRGVSDPCCFTFKNGWQVEKNPKPQASCAMPAGPGMKIKTDTPIVKKAREGVMEFLLVSATLARISNK